MKTFYSVVYVAIRPEIDEKISIGVLLSDGHKILFKYSDKKINQSKHFIPKGPHKLVKQVIENLDLISKSDNVKEYAIEPQLISDYRISKKYISYEYFEYLSKYSTNLVKYSKPIIISSTFHSKTIEFLFRTLVDNSPDEELAEIKTDIKNFFRKSFLPLIKNRVNTEFKVTQKHFDNLVAPVKVDAIGKNGSLMIANAIDFTGNEYPNDISKFIMLLERIPKIHHKTNKYFLVANEPSKDKVEAQGYWKTVKKVEFINIISQNELEIIKDYVEKNDVNCFEKTSS